MKMLFAGVLFTAVFSFNAEARVPSGRVDSDPVDTLTFVSPFMEDNESCFKCHGQGKYEYENELLGTTVRALMCPNQIIRREDFYGSNHRSFSCMDCHSTDYDVFPHPGELRMELKFNCLDCHGGDETYSIFSFEMIEEDYMESVHFKLENEGFSCWKCHDPHTYRINMRDSRNMKETILYDNNICLYCHSDYTRFQLLSDREEVNFLKTHDWLPNQASHFRSVRCIECHTQVNDSILVSHLVLPKDRAVKLCNECHSKNSLLMVSLYKFQSMERRRDGFLNGIIMNESYVIGANRNAFLGAVSLAIFGVLILFIVIHVIFRIKTKVNFKKG